MKRFAYPVHLLLCGLAASASAQEIERTKLVVLVSVDQMRADYLTRFGKFESIAVIDDDHAVDAPATALVGQMRILVPLGDLIDKDAELARLEREQGKTLKDMERIQAKLGNPNFIAKAPAEVVGKERDRAAELKSALDKLQTQLEKVRALA